MKFSSENRIIQIYMRRLLLHNLSGTMNTAAPDGDIPPRRIGGYTFKKTPLAATMPRRVPGAGVL